MNREFFGSFSIFRLSSAASLSRSESESFGSGVHLRYALAVISMGFSMLAALRDRRGLLSDLEQEHNVPSVNLN
jgi:hypothetical protein